MKSKGEASGGLDQNYGCTERRLNNFYNSVLKNVTFQVAFEIHRLGGKNPNQTF